MPDRTRSANLRCRELRGLAAVVTGFCRLIGAGGRFEGVEIPRMPAPEGRLCAVLARKARLGGLKPAREVAQSRLPDACVLCLSAFSCSRSVMNVPRLPDAIDRRVQCSCRASAITSPSHRFYVSDY